MAYSITSRAHSSNIHCNSPLKGTESDSDDETPELKEGEAKILYDQWKQNPQSLKIEAIVRTRNPFYPSQKLRQYLNLSLSETHIDDANLYLRFIPQVDQIVYYAYNQKNSYSTVKIVVLKKGSEKAVIALEKIFISTTDRKQQFSSLSGRLQAEVAPLEDGQLSPLIKSAIKDLAIGPESEMAFILKSPEYELQNIHALKSLVYRVVL